MSNIRFVWNCLPKINRLWSGVFAMPAQGHFWVLPVSSDRWARAPSEGHLQYCEFFRNKFRSVCFEFCSPFPDTNRIWKKIIQINRTKKGLHENLFNLINTNLHHSSDVGNVWRIFRNQSVGFRLTSQRTADIHRTQCRTIGLKPQHYSRCELVVSISTARLFLNFDHMNRIPASFRLFRSITRLFDQNHSRKSVVQVPKIYGRNSSFKVHFAVLVENLIGINFELSQSIGRQMSVVERRIVFVTPRRSVCRSQNMDIF